MKFTLKKMTLYVSVVLVLIVGTTAFRIFDDDDDFEIAKNLEIFHSVIRDVRLYYVDDVDYAELIKESTQELLAKLDPYTVYYPESLVEDYTFMTTGTYAGIGAEIAEYDNQLIVTEIYKNSPADKAGLEPGDNIVRINEKAVTPENIPQIKADIKGEAGSVLNLQIKRYGVDNKDIVIERAKIELPDVVFSGFVKDGIGYIKHTGFKRNSAANFKQALVKLNDSVKLKGLVIDLRNNPGGLLIEAVKIVNFFVDKNTEIVSTKGKISKWNTSFKTQNDPLFPDLPLCVIVNSSSASASEIVAGSLQDLDRAVIIGERTYGKGLVQTTRDLAYNSKIKITTAKYYIPSGRCVQALDYTHRKPDGSVGHIPDSLITEFRTQNGRKVFDGGGVSPDIQIDMSNPHSDFLSSSDLAFLIFNYATKYHSEHGEKPQIRNFKLSDKDYADFIKYAQESDFNFKSEKEILLDSLISLSENDDALITKLKSLKREYQSSVNELFTVNKDLVTKRLEAQIISRYYYAEGKLKFNFSKDENILKALDYLTDKKAYNTILAY